jgi:putative nucleotidyltransferase with HDIG domain
MPEKPRTPVYQLQAGVVLDLPVYHGGRTYFASGKILSNEDIQDLKLLGLESVALRETETMLGDQVQDDVMSQKLREHAISIVRRVYQNFQNLDREQASEIYSLGLLLKEEATRSTKLGIAVHDLRDHSNYTYQHSVNVTAISLAIGVRMGLSREELDHLSVGGLLHDIGKMKVSREILEREGKLTPEEMDLVRQHTVWGWDLLKEQGHFPPVVWSIARQHHETMEGGGYPDQLISSRIHLLSRIISVVDIWDALRSIRPYKAAWKPDQVLDFINGVTMVGKFDPQILEIFNNLIVPYPIGSRVMITGGSVAYVAGLNFGDFSRPILRMEEDGRFSYIDLMVRKSVRILKTLELAT